MRPFYSVLFALSAVAVFAQSEPQIVLLRTYVTTNTIPGYIGGVKSDAVVGEDGIVRPVAAPAIAITHPPRTVIATNYVLGFRQGTNVVEVTTIQK